MALLFTQLIHYLMASLPQLTLERMLLLVLTAMFTHALLMTMWLSDITALFNKEPDWKEGAKFFQTLSWRPVLWSQLDKCGEETQWLMLGSLLTKSCLPITPKVIQMELQNFHLNAIYGHKLSMIRLPMASLSRSMLMRNTFSSSIDHYKLKSLFNHSAIYQT